MYFLAETSCDNKSHSGDNLCLKKKKLTEVPCSFPSILFILDVIFLLSLMLLDGDATTEETEDDLATPLERATKCKSPCGSKHIERPSRCGTGLLLKRLNQADLPVWN